MDRSRTTILFHNVHLSISLKRKRFLIWMRSCGASRVLTGAIDDLTCLWGRDHSPMSSKHRDRHRSAPQHLQLKSLWRHAPRRSDHRAYRLVRRPVRWTCRTSIVLQEGEWLRTDPEPARSVLVAEPGFDLIRMILDVFGNRLVVGGFLGGEHRRFKIRDRQLHA